MMKFGQHRGTVLVSLVMVGLLAGCSATGSSTASSGIDRGGKAVAPAGQLPAGGVAQVAADNAGRQVVTHGTLQQTVADPRAAATAVVKLVEGQGGRVDARQEQAASDGKDAHAQLTVRIPSDELTATLAKLEDIGKVGQINVTSDDVTGTAEDLGARIKALQLSVARMEDLLARATSNADLISAENALSERQAKLESLQSEQARLAEKVALSTVEINLTAPGSAPVEATTHGFFGGIVAGWHALVVTLGGIVLVVGVLLPWLAFGGVITAMVWGVARWVRRRRTPVLGAPPVA